MLPKSRRRIKHFGIAALVAVAAGVGAAEPGDRDTGNVDISGDWVFSTDEYGPGTSGFSCSMKGHMSISAPADDGTQTCKFVSLESCDHGFGAEVRQACEVHRNGNKISITSHITEIVKMTPQRYGWAPDNWALTARSNREMEGILFSAFNAPARFTREPPPVS